MMLRLSCGVKSQVGGGVEGEGGRIANQCVRMVSLSKLIKPSSGQFTLVLGREVIYSAKTEDDHAPTTSCDLDR
jgi:hypothetical protein